VSGTVSSAQATSPISSVSPSGYLCTGFPPGCSGARGWDHLGVSRSDRAVFRLPAVSLVIPFLLFICVTPLATAGATFWLALYVLPLLGLIYILCARTVADASLIRTTGLTGGHRILWAELDRFEFQGARWAVAVTTEERRIRLPMVRPRDLPQLAAVSGGRLFLGAKASASTQSTGEQPVGVPVPESREPADGGAGDHLNPESPTKT